MTGTYYTAGAREIIARAVVGEIWNEFPDEAVKAQAVAEYTYIKKNNEMGVSPTTALKQTYMTGYTSWLTRCWAKPSTITAR